MHVAPYQLMEAWPVIAPYQPVPNGAVADGSMACHAHITPTREDTSNEVIGPPTGFSLLVALPVQGYLRLGQQRSQEGPALPMVP